jgi:hypothetical protein
MIESQTLLIAIAAFAPFLVRTGARTSAGRPGFRGVLISCAAAVAIVFACYAWYLPFDAWWFLRFLLPAFPAVFVLMAVSIAWLTGRLPAALRPVFAVAAVLFLVWHSAAFGRTHDVFDASGEWRFATAGRYAAERLPSNAAIFSMLHSGSARYYSGRLTVRYDHLAASQLQPTMAALRRLGYSPFVLLDDSEAQSFAAMFGGSAPLGAGGWPAVARLDGVTIYDASAPVPSAGTTSQ